MSPTPVSSLDLNQLKLVSVTFEVRSALNYFHWDRAGKVWSEITKNRPRLTVVTASPANTTFKEKRLRLGVSIKEVENHTSVFVDEKLPHQSLKDLIEISELLIEVTTRVLEIDEFTRVGLRLMFEKEYQDVESASAGLLQTGLLRYPPGPHFGFEGHPINPAFTIRFEDGKKGAMVHLTVDKRKIIFEPPPEWTETEGFQKEVTRLLLDLDYYTLIPVAKSQLQISDWINNASRLLRRDCGAFIKLA